MNEKNNGSRFYLPLKPPTDKNLLEVSKKGYEDMTNQEAKNLSRWKVDHLFPERLSVLIEVCEFDDIKLDFSIRSLVYVWEWFLKNMSYANRTEEEIGDEIRVLPDPLRSVVNIDRVKFDEKTFTMIYDISIYYGEVVIRHHPEIYWGVLLKRKRDFNYHKTVLMSSKRDLSFNTINMVNVLAGKAKDGNLNRFALLDHYTMYRETGVYAKLD
ncbi:hypothetical protein [Ferroacidibacillus organovorans]|uniref:Uncharacterized protein n=1 Tax=Ferroacidibacillus organovorans TaxID=1765683 RepID=A0A853KDR4_9BACL|nr:hypothetical protein [Ferroacidibacillus organovorans]KYP79255.1 hypothetical protein AYJ22_15195 [Ferroacidibacillus organovorans]OAG93540.1 hypothetical protein AYW79_10220 [Ferroacidibacillus organovorans]